MAELDDIRREKFCQFYVLDPNGARSATLAGYGEKGAKVQAHKLLQRREIQGRLTELRNGISREIASRREKVLRELEILGFSDLGHYTVTDDGSVEPTEGAPPDVMRAVSSIKVKRRRIGQVVETETEIKLWNKPASLKMLGDTEGLFRPGEGGGEDPTTPGRLPQRMKVGGIEIEF